MAKSKIGFCNQTIRLLYTFTYTQKFIKFAPTENEAAIHQMFFLPT